MTTLSSFRVVCGGEESYSNLEIEPKPSQDEAVLTSPRRSSFGLSGAAARKYTPDDPSDDSSWGENVSGYEDSDAGSDAGSVNHTMLVGAGMALVNSAAALLNTAYKSAVRVFTTPADKLRQPYLDNATTVKADTKPLGTGGFAAVHRIKWTNSDGNPVVMAGKFNNWGNVAKTEYALSSMVKEHDYLKEFKDNDCIIQVHPSFVASGDMLGFAMELGSGTLHGNMPTDSAGVKKVADAIFKMLNSLDSKGVVHRDLKAENIILVGDRWKLADFGIATMAGEPCADGGTEYMRSPESRNADADGILRARPPQDVFAGGLILQQVLLNANPGSPTLDEIGAPELHALITTVKQMIDPDPAKRPVF